MNDFLPRILTGLVLVIIITGSIIFGPYSFLLLILIINLLGVREFYKLFELSMFENTSGLFLSAFLFISLSLVISGLCDWRLLLLNIPIAFSVFVSELYLRSEDPFKKLAFIFLAHIYITVPCIFLICLAYLFPVKAIYYPYHLLGLFLIVWASDSGAYLTGKSLGKHALFKRISPHKTWEGSIGGAAFAILTALLVSTFVLDLKKIDWLVIAVIAIVIGTFGDFVKSLMKRSLGVKDTGNILPGHGGILDRFDSLFSSAPFVYCYLILTV